MADLSSRIEAVTVYRQGARVRRVAELAPEAGAYPTHAHLGNLPLSLDDSSVRVRLEPTNGAAVELPVAADLRVALEVPGVDTSLRPADDEALEAARLEVKRRELHVRGLGAALGRLAKLTVAPRPPGAEGEPPGESPLEARLALLRFRAEREQAVRVELRAAEDALEVAKRRSAELEDRERRATSARQAREHELRKAVVVSLRSEAAGVTQPVRVVLEYLVPGGSWAPAYALHLDPSLREAEVALRAVVAQQSGEDWSGVAITLSTAEATRWTELPELSSLRIGREQEPPAKTGWRPPPTGVEALYADYDRARPQPPPQQFQSGSAPPARTAFLAGELLDETAALALEEAPMPRAPLETAPVGGYGPPLAAPQSAPAFMQPRAKSAGPARALVAAASVAAAPVALAARGMSALFGASGGDSPARAEASAPSLVDDRSAGAAASVVQAPEDLLRYGDLRMPAASQPRRGRLTLATRQEIYLSLLVVQHVVVELDVGAAVDRAQVRATGLRGPLPPGHQPAWSDSFDYAYTAESPVDVPSDGEFHSVPLSSQTTGSSPLYIVVPRESTEVFRTVGVDNPLEAPLLPGPVDVYVGGDFLLTAALESTAPGGRFSVGLGVEQGLKVARNTRFREETSGLMGGRLSLQHTIEVDVRNNLSHDAELEVRERLPETREGEDEIEVVVVDVQPAWEPYLQRPLHPSEAPLKGGRRWCLRVKAGERQELHAEYHVRLAAKYELLGGNRREA